MKGVLPGSDVVHYVDGADLSHLRRIYSGYGKGAPVVVIENWHDGFLSRAKTSPEMEVINVSGECGLSFFRCQNGSCEGYWSDE